MHAILSTSLKKVLILYLIIKSEKLFENVEWYQINMKIWVKWFFWLTKKYQQTIFFVPKESTKKSRTKSE